MSVQDDLTQVAEDLTTAQTAVSQAVTDLSVPATESTGDTVLAAIVSALEAAGYTVTAPETETPADDGTETPADYTTETPA